MFSLLNGLHLPHIYFELFQQILLSLDITLSLLLFVPVLHWLHLDHADDVLDFNDQRAAEHVPEWDLQIDLPDLTMHQLEGHRAVVKQRGLQSHVFQQERPFVDGCSQLGCVDVLNESSQMLIESICYNFFKH